MNTRVIIADDHAMVRQTLRTLLERANGVEIVAEAVDGHQALALAKELKPDIVLIDISMPRMTGLEATAHISQLPQNTHVIVLSVHNGLLQAALDKGAAGYVLKQDSTHELADAIRTVSRGEKYISNRLTKAPV